MNKEMFRKISDSKVLVLDGATGTELTRNGMPAGVSPEAWVLENPLVLQKIQRSYVDAGSDAVYSCTFGGNRIKLKEFGLDDRTAEINSTLARISRDAVGDRALVFGDIAPTGLFIEPFGELPFEEAVAIFAEQAHALRDGGVDGIVIETMMDLQEARAALIGVKEMCNLPVMVSMTFGTDGRTLNGTDPLSALITLQTLGADAVGCNCSTGPQDMAQVIAAMKPYATVPLLAKPNAGMPKLVDGVTKFDMSPETFGNHAPLLVESGAAILGGCCGTAPSYIYELTKAVSSLKPVIPVSRGTSAVCSYKETHCLGYDVPMTVFGGKINPTGNSSLQSSLSKGDTSIVRRMAQQQSRKGASVIDINVNSHDVDEKTMMRAAVLATVKACGKPVAVDTVSADAASKALRVFPGRSILNSVCAKKGLMEQMCAIASRYGAMIVIMPIDDNGVPESVDDAIKIIDKIVQCAETYGIYQNDCIVDCLVLTAAAGPEAHKRTMELIKWCKTNRSIATLCGISNVSYKLDTRYWLDSTFLCMAAGHGLTAAFIDVDDVHTVNTAFALDALSGRDLRFGRYISRFAQKTESGNSGINGPRTSAEAVFDAVVTGDEEGIKSAIEKALNNGIAPKTLVDDSLIPAINQVGEKFDKKEYFLPQLITCADTMRKGFTVLQPFLNAGSDGTVTKKDAKVVLATVQGDIHDIGKNIVALMLNNYNFEVIDLGKDVSAEDIVIAAKKYHADIIGLSALMTTTMIEMKKVIELAKHEGLTQVRFMIGGAVVDQHYADEIGADGYASDAIGAVRLAQRLSEDHHE
ncbi:MAG: dihydropteroate synthase [Fibrobacter sp.]|nr:dihydropteroate synthase [Fibrobacter sp.]